MAEGEALYTFQLERVIGEEGSDAGEFAFPSDVAYGPDGLLYVADSDNHRVQVLTPEGEYVREFGEHGQALGQIRHPGYLSFGPDQSLYVTEWGSRRIQVFALDGTPQRIIDGNGIEGWGQPNGVAVTENGSLYVADRDAECIWALDAASGLMRGFGSNLHTPSSPVLDDDGNLYVGNFYEDGDIRTGSSVHVFVPGGTPIRTIGSQGRGTYELDAPEGLTFDQRGLLYVSQRDAHRVSIYTKAGKWVGQIGHFGNEPGGFYYPLGITSLPGNRIAVADSWNHRIQIFTPMP